MSGQDYTHKRETKFKPYMFSAAESNTFVSVGVVKTATSPVSLSALDSRLDDMRNSPSVGAVLSPLGISSYLVKDGL